MDTRFEAVLRMLACAFRSAVSEMDYHDIVQCLRVYRQSPDPIEDEHRLLLAIGWPITYHPCDHMENIRWCMCFAESNDEVRQSIVAFHAFDYSSSLPAWTTVPVPDPDPVPI